MGSLVNLVNFLLLFLFHLLFYPPVSLFVVLVTLTLVKIASKLCYFAFSLFGNWSDSSTKLCSSRRTSERRMNPAVRWEGEKEREREREGERERKRERCYWCSSSESESDDRNCEWVCFEKMGHILRKEWNTNQGWFKWLALTMSSVLVRHRIGEFWSFLPSQSWVKWTHLDDNCSGTFVFPYCMWEREEKMRVLASLVLVFGCFFFSFSPPWPRSSRAAFSSHSFPAELLLYPRWSKKVVRWLMAVTSASFSYSPTLSPFYFYFTD